MSAPGEQRNPQPDPQVVLGMWAYTAAVVLLAIIPLVLVVAPIALAVGALHAVGAAVTSLLRGSAERELPADCARPPGVEPAWPHYLGGQARRDAREMGAQMRAAAGTAWEAVGGLVEAYDDVDPYIPRSLLRPWLLVPVAAGAAHTLGAAAAGAAGGAVLGGAAATLWVVRGGVVAAARMIDRFHLARTATGATCTTPGCFGHTLLPLVVCPACGRQHFDLVPGPYGALRRRCTCGAMLPTTARTAARAAINLCCPWCTAPLPAGAMLERNIRLAVIGAPGSGKSAVVDAGLHDLAAAVTGAGGSMRQLPVPDASDDGARCATARVTTGRRSATLHVFDVPGDIAGDPLRSIRLRHVRQVHGIALVIDAGTLPRLVARLDDPQGIDERAVDPEFAYRCVAAELRDQRVDLGSLSLCVVLHKADVLRTRYQGRGPAGSSGAIREWLEGIGHRNLVLAVERDFRSVRYVLTSTNRSEDTDGVHSPAAALAWLVHRAGYRLPTPRDGL